MTKEQQEKFLREYLEECKNEKGEYANCTPEEAERIIAVILDLAERI